MSVYTQNKTVSDIITTDTAIYDGMLAEFNAGSYPIDAPFWRLDPYSASPLTAQAGFKTSTPTKLTVTVTAGNQAISHDFDSNYTTEHFFPVLGLCSTLDSTVLYVATDENDQSTQHQFDIPTSDLTPLPANFGIVEVIQAPNLQKLNEKLYMTYMFNSIPAAIDYQGAARWFIY